jgi:hypothetical protein
VATGHTSSSPAAPSRRIVAPLRARLRSATGVELEDTLEGGEVHFLTDDAIQTPLEVELYESAGSLAGRHSAFSF